jgi:hypothetical protein
MNISIKNQQESHWSGKCRRDRRPSKNTLKALPKGIAAVFFAVSVYWAILYRTSWNLDWAAFATFLAIIASIIASLDLVAKRKSLRRMSDTTIKKELALVLGYIFFVAVIYFRTMVG